MAEVIDFHQAKQRKARRTEPRVDKHQVAEFFAVSERSVRRWVEKGCPVHPLKGGALRFILSEVIAWHESP